MMNNINYSIENSQLVVREPTSGKTIWSGGFEAPILQIVALPNLDGCLVLLDPSTTKKPTFENLFKVGPDGKIHWKAQLPRSHDAFTRVIDLGDRMEAQTWTGQLVEIDLVTGKTRNQRFVK
jgi:hypothetical protein